VSADVKRLCSVCAEDLVAPGALPLCEDERCHKRYFDALGDRIDAEYASEEAQAERYEKRSGRDDKLGGWRY